MRFRYESFWTQEYKSEMGQRGVERISPMYQLPSLGTKNFPHVDALLGKFPVLNPLNDPI